MGFDWKVDHKSKTITITGSCQLNEFAEEFSKILKRVINSHRG